MLTLTAVKGPQSISWSQNGAACKQEKWVGERRVQALRCGLSLREGGMEKSMSARWPALSVQCPHSAFPRHKRAALPEEGVGVEPVVEDPVTREGAVQEHSVAGLEGPTVKLKFKLQRECHFGQQFNVVGNDARLGAWEPSAAVPLNWSEYHIWTTEVDVPEGKQIEFKYVLTGKDGEIEWQPGPNHVVEAVSGPGPILVSEPWEDLQPDATNDLVLQPNGSSSQLEEPGDDKPEVSSPADVLADTAASAAVSALNTGLKAATAVEGGVAAVTSLSEPSREGNNVADSIEETPTAIEVPVLDAALSSAAEEVRGESKETEETTSNDA